MSFVVLKPQHCRASWILRMASPSWEVQRDFHFVSRRQGVVMSEDVDEAKRVARMVVRISWAVWRRVGRSFWKVVDVARLRERVRRRLGR